MNIQNMETIGGRLKFLRENEDLTQKELGFEFGIQRNLISMYESEDRPLPVDILLKYSQRFCISTDWILKGVETSSKDWRKLNEYYGYDEIVAIFDSFHNPMLRSVALNQLRILQDMNKVVER